MEITRDEILEMLKAFNEIQPIGLDMALTKFMPLMQRGLLKNENGAIVVSNKGVKFLEKES